MDSLNAMQRGYDRRQELIGDSDVEWVRMGLDAHGVTLTIARRDGSREVEFIAKSDAEGAVVAT